MVWLGLIAFAVQASLHGGPPRALAQAPVPVDPDQLRNDLSRSLVRLVMDRPRLLAEQAAAASAESAQLAQDLVARLSAGQGPNGGPPPLGLEVESGQIAAAAQQCAAQAQQNIGFAQQDLEVLKGVLGGKLDLDTEPGPEGALSIVRWLSGMVVGQRQRNAAVEQCVQQSMLGLGRLQAFRSLYPS